MKARREKLGLTQAEVAAIVKTSQQAYARIESNGDRKHRKDIKLGTAERIAAALGVKLDALLAKPRR